MKVAGHKSNVHEHHTCHGLEALRQRMPEAIIKNVEQFGAEQAAIRDRLIGELQTDAGTLEDLFPETKKASTSSREDRDLSRLALEFLGASPHMPASSLQCAATKDIKFQALEAALRRSADHLKRLANSGDERALGLIARHALSLTRELTRLRRKFRGTFLRAIRPVARESISWPVQKSFCMFYDDTGQKIDKGDARFLRQLEVGDNHPIRGHKFNPNDKLSELVLELFESIRTTRHPASFYFSMLRPLKEWEAAAAQLHPIKKDRQVAGEWWRVMKLRLDELYPTDKKLVGAFRSHTEGAKSRKTDERKADYIRKQLREKFMGMLGLFSVAHKSRTKTERLPHAKSNSPEAFDDDWIKRHRDKF